MMIYGPRLSPALLRLNLIVQLALRAWVPAAIFVAAISGFCQTPAFPGALGYGAYATGGRNGSVYHVTNLNDSGAGSFRTGVSSGNRVIVFDVGGHITLQSAVSCQGNLTIAGQTAPGGICFDAGEISFSSRANIICRHLRIRPGSNTASVNDDCLGLYESTNMIFDHVSIGFGPYDNIDAVTANNLSFQNCIDSDPIGQQFGAHIENVGAFCSWQYNLFVNSHNRNPLAKINDTFINNVEYNCNAGYTTHTSTPFKHDIVNNYFVAGPAYGGSSDFPWFQVDDNQSIYQSGNLFDSNDNGLLDGSSTTVYWYQDGTGTILSAPWSSWTSVIPTVCAPLAWRYVVSAAGAFPRDDVDSLSFSQVNTIGSGTAGTGAGTAGPGGGLYTSQTQTGLSNSGYGSLTGGVAASNFSGDGIADYWKLANNLSTNISYPLTNTADGYTLLEHYLNFLGAPHAVTRTNTPVLINLSQFTAGFSASSTFSLTNATNGTVSLLNGTNANFIPTANFSGSGSFNFIVNDSSYAMSARVTVCVTPVLPPASATSFFGALVTVATNAAASVSAPPNNLLWRGDGAANAWNTTVSNWLDDASVSLFKSGDVVTFDDTGSASPAINLTTTVSPGAIYFNDTQNYTLSGVGSLSGSATLSKTGAGALFVNTTNSGYSGSVVLNGGSLVLGSGASVGSGNLTIDNGAILGLSANNAIYPANPVTVAAGQSGTITNVGIGNGFSGAFSSGDTNSLLNLLSSMSFEGTDTSQFNGFRGTINIVAGSTLRFVATSNTIGSLNPSWIINGTMQPRNAGNTILLGSISGSGQLAGPQTYTSGYTGNTAYIIGGNNLSSIFSGTIVSNANSAGTLVCVNKVGTGTLALSGSNTFGGTNAVLAGTLLVNGTNLPLLTTVFAGATLGGTGVISGPVCINSGAILSPGANGSGILTINGNLTNNSPILNYSLSGSPSGENDLLNMTGTLAMSGAQTFNFNLSENSLGAGTYRLIEGATNSTQSSVSFVNNLPGNTRQIISFTNSAPGTNPSYIRLTVAGAAASLIWRGTNGLDWDTSTVNWANGSMTDVYYNLDTVTFDDTGANPTGVTLANTLTPAAMAVNSSQSYTFGGNGSLAGSGPMTKLGFGTLTISTTNLGYAGNFLLSGGTLAANAPSSLGSGALTISSGATLSLPASGVVFFGGPVTIPANTTGTISSGALGNSISGHLCSGNSNSLLNLSGGVSLSGTNSAQFDSFTGTINVPSGATLRYSANSSGNTYGSFSPTLVVNGTLQPRNAGNTIQLGAFTGCGTLGGQQATNAGTGPTTYVIGGNNTSATFCGTIVDANSTNLTTLYKIGTGTLTLSGNSTFTGGTTVSAGTLLVNNPAGSAIGTGDLEIFSGATLTGSGSIGSSTTVDNGATLAPGSPGGTLAIANDLTLNDNSILRFGLGTSSVSVVVNGALFLTGQLNVTNAGGFGVGAYPLFTCFGALTIGNLALASAPTGYNYSFNTNTPGIVKLVVAPTVPPQFGSTIMSCTNLVFSGNNGAPLGIYYVLTATNLILPTASWTRVATNQFDSGGNFSFTNSTDPAMMQTFVRLQVP